MFGKFALNPAVRVIEKESDRGRVIDTPWNAYNVINAVSLTAIVLGWAGARFTEARPDRLGSTERGLATAKDGLVVLSVVTGVISGVQGGRLAAQATDGAVPMESGTEPSSDTPAAAAKIQRTLGAAGNVNIASGVALVIVNAVMAQAAYSRPPPRRALLRRSKLSLAPSLGQVPVDRSRGSQLLRPHRLSVFWQEGDDFAAMTPGSPQRPSGTKPFEQHLPRPAGSPSAQRARKHC